MSQAGQAKEPAAVQAAPVSDGMSQWDRVAAMDEFKQLLKNKAAFIVPATIIFVVYYFLLPVSVGYFPKFMDKRVGPVNLAYLFALSQFFVAWAIAALYVRAASRFDEQSARLLDKLGKGGK
jgi:uncharacterized membrane protein (DUF485 family)